MSEQIVKAPHVPPFVTFVTSAVPMVFDNSLSYYEALCALWKWLQDDVVNVINNNATVTEDYIDLTNEYIEKFNELKEYVDTYFDNLDVQEEINNKLDAMVEDGTLQELVNNFLQPNVAWTFDTVAGMKASENLVAGGYARTLGFHSMTDGGGAYYKIKEHEAETINEMDVIAIDDTLIAVFVPQGNMIRPEQIGAYSDGSQDSINYIHRAITLNKRNVVMDGTYLITSPITITSQTNVNISGRGTVNCNSGYALVIDGCGWSSVENLRFNSPNGMKITGTSGAVQYIYLHNLRFNGNNTASSVGILAESPSYYCNEVTYEQCVVYGYSTGIYVNSDGTYECASHKFVRCSTEGCTLGQHLVNSSFDTFEMCRHVEAGSLKWKTEGTCNQLLIIGGFVSNNASGSVDFSSNTSGTIFGRVRMGGIYNTDASKSFSIVAGKIIPSENSCSEEYADLGSDNTIPSYGYTTVYASGRCYNTQTTTTTTLDSAYYGGRNKINNFMLRIGGNCHKVMQMGTKTFDIDNSSNPSDKLILFSWHANAGWTVQTLATSYTG